MSAGTYFLEQVGGPQRRTPPSENLQLHVYHTWKSQRMRLQAASARFEYVMLTLSS